MSTVGHQRLSRRTACLAVTALTLFALAVRLVGLDFQLPHVAHGDERAYWKQIEVLRRDDPQGVSEAWYQRYPDLVARITALATRPPAAVEGAILEKHVERASTEFVHLRATVAWLSVLLVPATYRLARRFLDRRAAIFAAALAATSVLDQWYAQQARPHAAAAALTTLSMLAALALVRRPSFGRYVLAGMLAGLALGTLQSAIALAPALLVAHVMRPRSAARRAWIGPAAAVAAVALSVAVFYPFAFAGQRGVALEADEGAPGTVHFYGHLIFLRAFDGQGFRTLLAKAYEFDPWILALVVFALVRVGLHALRSVRVAPTRELAARFGAWMRAHTELVVVLAFALPYGLVIGLYAESYERFLLPLLPYAAILAAFGVLGVGSRRSFAVVAWSVIALQAACDVRFAWLRATPDTMEQAAAWVTSHVDPQHGRIATLPFVDLPVLRNDASMRADEQMVGQASAPWFGYLASLDASQRERGYELALMPISSDDDRRSAERDPDAFVRGLHADYAILYVGTDDRDLFRRIRVAVRARGKLVAQFRPFTTSASEDDPVRFPSWVSWIWILFHSRALGPWIEIYALPD